MRFTRVAAAATSLLLVGASVSLGSAGAAPTGVGTAGATTNVLDVALGNAGALLHVKVLSDQSQSTIDSKTSSTPLADSKLTAASVASSVVPALNLSIPAGGFEAKQPGGAADVNQPSLDLANPSIAGLIVPTSLGKALSGTVNLAHLTAAAAAGSAKSTLTESLTDLGVAGGLLGAHTVSSTSGSNAANTESDSTREVKVDAITVLDLGSLLEGLGIPLTDLTASQIDDILKAAQVAIPGIDPGATLQSTIDAVQNEVNTLTTALQTNTGLVDGTTLTVSQVVDSVGLGGIIPSTTISGITGNAVSMTNQTIDAIQAGLAALLANGLTALDSAPLLKISGVDVGVTTKAADTAANSVADVKGTIGSVTVGTITLPGIDLIQTAATINSALANVNNAVGNVLSKVAVPVNGTTLDLQNLVSVSVLQPTKSITTSNGYTVANAGITAVSATVKPPADLATIVNTIVGQNTAGTSIGSVITGLSGTVPALDPAMADLQGVLGATTTALGGGAGINVVQVLGNSEFKVNPSVATPTNGTLPKTGNESARLAALGLLLVALGLGLGAWFDMPMPAVVRRRFEFD
jgi:hypothetical protein